MSARPLPHTGKALATLRESLGLTQAQMGTQLGVTREWISKLENEAEPISEFVKLKLNDLVNPRVNQSHILAEDPAPYGRLPPVNLRPEFSPPAPLPTRQDCVAHVAAYLDAAAQVPGGYAIALHKIKRALPLDEFAPAKNFP